jgi:ankyrin repeat protein
MPKIEIPEKLLCPITLQMFKEPVVAEDGHTYEKEAIEKWVVDSGTSPKTREKIGNKFVINWDKKSQISKFIEKSKACTDKEFIKAIQTEDTNKIQKLNYLDIEMFGSKPLHYAIYQKNIELLKFLLAEKANIESRDLFDHTPLFVAVKRNHFECVKILLENNADVKIIPKGESIGNQTVLHVAASTADADVVNLLLDKKLEIEASDDNGMTPLHWAAQYGKIETVKLLLDKGANFYAKDNYGETPLFATLYSVDEQLAVFKLLISLSEKSILESLKNRAGKTILHAAVDRGNITALKLLLDFKINLELKDDIDSTPMHLAASNSEYEGKVEIVKLLIANGADLEAKDIDGRTPLHNAAIYGNKEIVKLLLENGANYKSLDNEGKTPTAMLKDSFFNHDKHDMVQFIPEYHKALKLKCIKSLNKISTIERENKQLKESIINLSVLFWKSTKKIDNQKIILEFDENEVEVLKKNVPECNMQ